MSRRGKPDEHGNTLIACAAAAVGPTATLVARAETMMFSLSLLVLTLGGPHVLESLILLGAATVLMTVGSDPRLTGATARATITERQPMRGAW